MGRVSLVEACRSSVRTGIMADRQVASLSKLVPFRAPSPARRRSAPARAGSSSHSGAAPSSFRRNTAPIATRSAGAQSHAIVLRRPDARSKAATDFAAALARNSVLPSAENDSPAGEDVPASGAASTWGLVVPPTSRSRITPAPPGSTTAASCPPGANAASAPGPVCISSRLLPAASNNRIEPLDETRISAPSSLTASDGRAARRGRPRTPTTGLKPRSNPPASTGASGSPFTTWTPPGASSAAAEPEGLYATSMAAPERPFAGRSATAPEASPKTCGVPSAAITRAESSRGETHADTTS